MKDVPLLTADQREVGEWFCLMTDRNEGGMLLLDAPGGTGYYQNVKSEAKITLATG